MPLKDTQRMWDLVRQQRMELFEADLITQDEYAALAIDHPAVARLESYDELRSELQQTKDALASAKEIELQLRAEIRDEEKVHDAAFLKLQQQLAQSQEVARKLAEALNPFAKAWRTFKALHSQFTTGEFYNAKEALALYAAHRPADFCIPKTMEQSGAISVDPDRQGGLPCIAGTRIPVHSVLWAIEHSGSIEGALKSYPHLTTQQVKDALYFAQGVVAHRPVEPHEPLASSEPTGTDDDLIPRSTAEGYRKYLERLASSEGLPTAERDAKVGRE